jgi:hypothetical protein
MAASQPSRAPALVKQGFGLGLSSAQTIQAAETGGGLSMIIEMKKKANPSSD